MIRQFLFFSCWMTLFHLVMGWLSYRNTWRKWAGPIIPLRKIIGYCVALSAVFGVLVYTMDHVLSAMGFGLSSHVSPVFSFLVTPLLFGALLAFFVYLSERGAEKCRLAGKASA
jgi:hypothetical protein